MCVLLEYRMKNDHKEVIYVSTCLLISLIVRGGVCTEKKTWTNTVEIKGLLSLNGQKVIQKQLAHTEFSRKQKKYLGMEADDSRGGERPEDLSSFHL